MLAKHNQASWSGPDSVVKHRSAWYLMKMVIWGCSMSSKRTNLCLEGTVTVAEA